MALKTRKKRIDAPATSPRRKAKFQADLAPAEDRSVRLLKEELQLSSNTDFLSDAVALVRWAVIGAEIGAPDHERERERGAKGAALSAAGTRGSRPCPATCGYQMDWARTGKSC